MWTKHVKKTSGPYISMKNPQLCHFVIIHYLYLKIKYLQVFILLYIFCHAASWAMLIAKELLLFPIMFTCLSYNLIMLLYSWSGNSALSFPSQSLCFTHVHAVSTGNFQLELVDISCTWTILMELNELELTCFK